MDGSIKDEEAFVEWLKDKGIDINEASQNRINSLKDEWKVENNKTKYSQYQLPGGPLSRDTEILTTSGWKRVDCIPVGETVLSRSDSDGALEWVKVEKTPKIFSDKMYHFKSQSLDMLVSSCHQMIVEKRSGDNKHRKRTMVRMRADELWNTWDCRIPLSGNALKGGASDKLL